MSRKKVALTTLLIFMFVVAVANVLVGVLVGWDAAKAPWEFLSTQVLGMKWLSDLLWKLAYLFGTFEEGSWQNAVQASAHFFVYDMAKISILLCVLIFAISYVQSYFPPEKTKKILGRFHGVGANVLGALLGTVTPFCSCSSIPIFIGFTRAGLSSGVTFSFLISSPLVDLGSLMLLVGFFGWPVAIVYVLVGLLLAVIGGTIIDKTGLGKHVEDFVLQGENVDIDSPTLSQKDRLIYAKNQMSQTYKKVWLYMVIGVGVGCVIHNFIPQNWVETLLGGDKWYGVPLATLLGAPMYADIFGTLPVAESLFGKGAGLGTVLAFMMSVTALSLPSLIMLRKAVKPKLLLWFVAIVIVGITVIGFVFNLLGYLFV